jgi:thiol-disulfide isomerase/thioredoxin
MPSEPANQAPDALLLLAPGCPHCPVVLQGLLELVEDGTIGRLEAVNIARHPEIAQQLGVRSVPWVRLGEFELTGLHSAAELRAWAERAGTSEGLAAWFGELIVTGKLARVIRHVREHPGAMAVILDLLGDPDTELNVRIGIGALMEEFAGSDLLRRHIGDLGRLTRHEDARVRNDACHYLSLTGDPAALPFAEALLDDPDPDVRETAGETLDALRSDA